MRFDLICVSEELPPLCIRRQFSRPWPSYLLIYLLTSLFMRKKWALSLYDCLLPWYSKSINQSFICTRQEPIKQTGKTGENENT